MASKGPFAATMRSITSSNTMRSVNTKGKMNHLKLLPCTQSFSAIISWFLWWRYLFRKGRGFLWDSGACVSAFQSPFFRPHPLVIRFHRKGRLRRATGVSLRVYMCYTATALQGKFVSIPPFFVLESTVDTGWEDWLYIRVRDERKGFNSLSDTNELTVRFERVSLGEKIV